MKQGKMHSSEHSKTGWNLTECSYQPYKHQSQHPPMGSNAHLCSSGWKLFIHVTNHPPRYSHISPVQDTRQPYGPTALPENGVWGSQGASPAWPQPPPGIFSMDLKENSATSKEKQLKMG